MHEEYVGIHPNVVSCVVYAQYLSISLTFKKTF